MRTIIRSFGLAALGAIAITAMVAQGPHPTEACDASKAPATHHCTFELLVWDLVRESGDEGELKAYILMYPEGRFVREAQRQLERLMPRYGVAPPRSILS